MCGESLTTNGRSTCPSPAVRVVREPHHERTFHLSQPSRSGGLRASPRADVPPAPAQPFGWFESLTTNGRSTCPSQSVRMVRGPHHERTFHLPQPSRSNGSRASPLTDVPPVPAQPFEWFESLTTGGSRASPRADVPPAPAQPFEWFESLTTNGRSTCPQPSRSNGSRASPRADVPPAPAQPFEWFESLTMNGRSTCPSPSVRVVRGPHHERTFHLSPPSRSNGSRASP